MPVCQPAAMLRQQLYPGARPSGAVPGCLVCGSAAQPSAHEGRFTYDIVSVPVSCACGRNTERRITLSEKQVVGLGAHPTPHTSACICSLPGMSLGLGALGQSWPEGLALGNEPAGGLHLCVSSSESQINLLIKT